MGKKGKISYAKYGYIFCIPFLVAYLIFNFYPTLYTTLIGFTDLRGVNKTNWNFLGFKNIFDNYKHVLFEMPLFKVALKNTVKLWICNFVPQLTLALLLSAWFTNHRVKVPGQSAFKVLFYMPNIITSATVAILFSALFAYPMGPVNDMLVKIIGPDYKPFFFLNSKNAAQGIIMFIQTWMWYGYTMIIIISGVLGISPDIFEAADIDGASGWQVFWKITIPNIKTILLFTLVNSLIGGLNMFDIPFLLVPQSGPDNATLTTNVLIYMLAFKDNYISNWASAMSMIMFIIIICCSAILFFILRDRDEVAIKKAHKLQMKAYRKQQREIKHAQKNSQVKEVK